MDQAWARFSVLGSKPGSIPDQSGQKLTKPVQGRHESQPSSYYAEVNQPETVDLKRSRPLDAGCAGRTLEFAPSLGRDHPGGNTQPLLALVRMDTLKIRGARTHNLQNIDLDLHRPTDRHPGYLVPANLRWPSIRSTPKVSAAMSNHCRPMLGSFSP